MIVSFARLFSNFGYELHLVAFAFTFAAGMRTEPQTRSSDLVLDLVVIDQYNWSSSLLVQLKNTMLVLKT